MKTKTSITLSENVLKEMESSVVFTGNRSIFIEKAIWTYLDLLKKQQRDMQDLELINKNADKLNKEVEETLSFQVSI